MFSLIVTLISIALVIALAIATMYYGGNAFHNWRNAAKAATLASQASQVYAAAQLWYQDKNTWPADPLCLLGTGQGPASCNANTTQYLSGMPVPPQGALIAAADYTLDAAFAQIGPGLGGGGADANWTFVLDGQGTLTYLNIANLIAQDVCQVVGASARGSSLLTMVPYEEQVQSFKDNFESMFAAEIAKGVTPSLKITQIGIMLEDWYAGDQAMLTSIETAQDAAALKTLLASSAPVAGGEVMLDILAKAAVIPPSVNPNLVYQCVDEGLASGGASTFTYFWKTPVAVDPCSAVGVYNAGQQPGLGCGETTPQGGPSCPIGQHDQGGQCVCDLDNTPPNASGQCPVPPSLSCPTGQHWQDGNTTCLCDGSNAAPDIYGQCAITACAVGQDLVGTNGRTTMLDLSAAGDDQFQDWGSTLFMSGGEITMANIDTAATGGTWSGVGILEPNLSQLTGSFSNVTRIELEFEYLFEATASDALLSLDFTADYAAGDIGLGAIGIQPASGWRTARIQVYTGGNYTYDRAVGGGILVNAYTVSNSVDFTGTVKIRGLKYNKVDDAWCRCPDGFAAEADGQCHTYSCVTGNPVNPANIMGEDLYVNFYLINEQGRAFPDINENHISQISLAGQTPLYTGFNSNSGSFQPVFSAAPLALLPSGRYPMTVDLLPVGRNPARQFTCQQVLATSLDPWAEPTVCLTLTPGNGPAEGGNTTVLTSVDCLDGSVVSNHFVAGPGGEAPVVLFNGRSLPSSTIQLLSGSQLRAVVPPAGYNPLSGERQVWADVVAFNIDGSGKTRPAYYTYDGDIMMFSSRLTWTSVANSSILVDTGTVDSRGMPIKYINPDKRKLIDRGLPLSVGMNGQGLCGQPLLGLARGWGFNNLKPGFKIMVGEVEATVLDVFTTLGSPYIPPRDPEMDAEPGPYDTVLFKLPSQPTVGPYDVRLLSNASTPTKLFELFVANPLSYSNTAVCSMPSYTKVRSNEHNWALSPAFAMTMDSPGAITDLLTGLSNNIALVRVNGMEFLPSGPNQSTFYNHFGMSSWTSPVGIPNPTDIETYGYVTIDSEQVYVDITGWQPAPLAESLGVAPLFFLSTGMPMTVAIEIETYDGGVWPLNVQALRPPVVYGGQCNYSPANAADSNSCPASCVPYNPPIVIGVGQQLLDSCMFFCSPYYAVNGNADILSMRSTNGGGYSLSSTDGGGNTINYFEYLVDPNCPQ